MNPTTVRTPRECIQAVLDRIQFYIKKEVCQCCAITMAGHDLKMARMSVEDVWVNHHAALLDAETALD